MMFILNAKLKPILEIFSIIFNTSSVSKLVQSIMKTGKNQTVAGAELYCE